MTKRFKRFMAFLLLLLLQLVGSMDLYTAVQPFASTHTQTDHTQPHQSSYNSSLHLHTDPHYGFHKHLFEGVEDCSTDNGNKLVAAQELVTILIQSIHYCFAQQNAQLTSNMSCLEIDSPSPQKYLLFSNFRV